MHRAASRHCPLKPIQSRSVADAAGARFWLSRDEMHLTRRTSRLARPVNPGLTAPIIGPSVRRFPKRHAYQHVPAPPLDLAQPAGAIGA